MEFLDFLGRNLFLVAIALVSGTMLIWPVLRRRAGGPWVDTLQATQLMNREDALVLDVRTADEYAKGHILGARNVPLDALAARLKELDKHKAKPVIVHCADGNRASGAAAVLRQNGFQNVVTLAGGFGGWQSAGLPTEK